jgi:hypothetical protein
MNERPEQDEFDEEEDLEAGEDLDSAMREFDHTRRRPAKGVGDPAWRRLERLREDRRTAELTSDFDDYDIGPEPTSLSGSRANAPAARPKKPNGR